MGAAQALPALLPGFTSLNHGAERDAAGAKGFFCSGYSAARFPFPLSYTKKRFLARSLSSSFVPEPGTAGYRGYREALRALLDAMFPGDMLTLPNEMVMLWGRP